MNLIKKLFLHYNVRKNSRRLYSTFKKSCPGGGETCNPLINIELENAFKLYNLDDEPESEVCLSKKEALKYYTDMQIIRRMENALANLYRLKEIRGFCHLYTGQEACCVGMHAVMRPMDSIITSYRSHGWTYVMGISVHDIIAELIQKRTGCSRGKGGSMHTYSKNFYGGNGIVGAQCPLGAGVALAHAYRCDGGVCFSLYGDGAANQGQLFEAFNMACLWKLPAVFVCENNQYGMGTSVERGSCNPNYYTRGDYIPGIWINAMDVLSVRSGTKYAIKHATTIGPLVVELETYRYFGHSMSDPGTSYRKREEVENIRKTNDPILNLKNICLKNNLISEEEFKKIDDDIKKDIDEDVKEAKAAKFPELHELTSDVYLHNYEKQIRGTVFRNLKHSNIGSPFVPLGAAKATPRSQINLPESKADAKDTKADKKDEKAQPANAQVPGKHCSLAAAQATPASPPNPTIPETSPAPTTTTPPEASTTPPESPLPPQSTTDP